MKNITIIKLIFSRKDFSFQLLLFVINSSISVNSFAINTDSAQKNPCNKMADSIKGMNGLLISANI